MIFDFVNYDTSKCVEILVRIVSFWWKRRKKDDFKAWW